MQFLVSAGEASSDLYAAGVVEHLSAALPGTHFYGCAGPRLQAAGVEPVLDAREIAVVGLAEVVHHLPRIYSRYRALIRHIEKNPPAAALLTDSPDFHLRLARHLRRLHIPVFYLVAPQVWAWREGRVRTIRSLVDKLLCLFPFEEPWFRERGVDATYIGHPLASMVRPRFSRGEFLARNGISGDRPLVVLLPGSRAGEARRHLPVLIEATAQLKRHFQPQFILATPKGFESHSVLASFREPLSTRAIKIVENEAWDSIAHADVALAASGTVTIEAAVLGTPMVTFYKVNPLSWHAGRRLVKVPFLSMVNLVAGRKIVPELIQNEMTAESIAAAASNLLANPAASAQMRSDLAEVRNMLSSEGDPLARAAQMILESAPLRRETIKER